MLFRNKKTKLEIANMPAQLVLTIEDDRIGIDNLGSEITEGHYGLQNMAHRAKEIGAQLSFAHN